MLERLSWLPWLLWLALNGVQSRANRRTLARAGATPAVKEPRGARRQHLAALAGAAALLLPWPRLGPLNRHWLPSRSGWRAAGLPLEVLGFGLALWTRAALGRHWTGRVALAADQPLLIDGPYGLARHPLYSGLLGGALGTAIVQGRWRGLLGFALLVAAYRRKVGYEERALRDHFGDRYARYAGEVPAFLPRLPDERISEMSVEVRGDIDHLWRLASDIPGWAAFLPHYRYVRVLAEDGGRRTVEMSARRGVIPITWVSTLALDPAGRRIHFEHIGGGARGMLVEWQLVQDDGYVQATIRHDLRRLQIPLVAGRLGRYILSQQIIEPIAGRTLRCMQALVEERVGMVSGECALLADREPVRTATQIQDV